PTRRVPAANQPCVLTRRRRDAEEDAEKLRKKREGAEHAEECPCAGIPPWHKAPPCASERSSDRCSLLFLRSLRAPPGRRVNLASSLQLLRVFLRVSAPPRQIDC